MDKALEEIREGLRAKKAGQGVSDAPTSLLGGNLQWLAAWNLATGTSVEEIENGPSLQHLRASAACGD
jgi:hypothetical protein